MGTDIHACIEYWDAEDSKWRGCGLVKFGREYSLFGLMAGGRVGDGRLWRQAIPLRGLPPDTTKKTLNKYTLRIVDGNPGKHECTRARAAQYARWGAQYIGDDRIAGPDYHSASWISPAELRHCVRVFETTFVGLVFESLGRPRWLGSLILKGHSLKWRRLSRVIDSLFLGYPPRPVTRALRWLARRGVRTAFMQTVDEPVKDVLTVMEGLRHERGKARLVFWFDN